MKKKRSWISILVVFLTLLLGVSCQCGSKSTGSGGGGGGGGDKPLTEVSASELITNPAITTQKIGTAKSKTAKSQKSTRLVAMFMNDFPLVWNKTHQTYTFHPHQAAEYELDVKEDATDPHNIKFTPVLTHGKNVFKAYREHLKEGTTDHWGQEAAALRGHFGPGTVFSNVARGIVVIKIQLNPGVKVKEVSHEKFKNLIGKEGLLRIAYGYRPIFNMDRKKKDGTTYFMGKLLHGARGKSGKDKEKAIDDHAKKLDGLGFEKKTRPTTGQLWINGHAYRPDAFVEQEIPSKNINEKDGWGKIPPTMGTLTLTLSNSEKKTKISIVLVPFEPMTTM